MQIDSINNSHKENKIAFVVLRYSFEVSPTIKGLIRFLQDNKFDVDIITDKFYRDQSFSLSGVNIITLDSIPATIESYSSLLSSYKYLFAIEYLSLTFLDGINIPLSNVVYLSLESTQLMLKESKEVSLGRLNRCKFGVIQSKERYNDFCKYFDNKLKIDFEFLPVSIRPVKINSDKNSAKIIYSGYLSEWSGMLEFLALFNASRYRSYYELLIQGHSMGTEYYAEKLKQAAGQADNIKIDLGYYNDQEHIKLLGEHNIGIAVYKNTDASANWDNLLFSSGKIAAYLWAGCAVITNLDHELTRKPPFIFLNSLDDITSLERGFEAYNSNISFYFNESIRLAEKYYNLDEYALNILNRLSPEDKYAEQDKYVRVNKPFAINKNEENNFMVQNSQKDSKAPVKLHLGCGENYIPGYINIDYPPDEHAIMKVRPDVACDLMELSFPDSSVDEIRLHHVFEHFNRVTALALLMRWHKWLKVGGVIHIETPDLMGSAKTLLSDASLRVKMGVVRHLAGDQAAAWAFHIDHWFPERYEHTLKQFGFGNINITSSSWSREPYLSNVDVKAVKIADMSNEEMLKKADELLWESTVSDKEKPTHEVWKEQLRKAIRNENIYGETKTSNPVKADENSVALSLPRVDKIGTEAFDFNQRERDNWVKQKAQEIAPGLTVLDVGAGTCPYRSLFSHCNYITHDFKKYEGVKLGKTNDYGSIDIESDILNIPLEDNSVDVILCTEVLEHVPEPIGSLKEMARILKPGGRLLVTAPLGSGLHQLPYHYYGGYTPEWYKHFGNKFGLDVSEITPNGGFLKLLSQESLRFFSTLPNHSHLHGNYIDSIKYLFGEWLPKYLYKLEDHYMMEQFTVGYHVEFRKADQTKSLKNYDEKSELKPSPGKLKASGKASVQGIIFSKNRAMQLDAVLKSFFLHCADPENVNLSVLYTADEKYLHQYRELEKEYPGVRFVIEKNFKAQLVNMAADSKYILFLVDDNIFVRNFSINELTGSLERIPESIGFSLRLGENTTYCYTKNAVQTLPDFKKVKTGILSFNWTTASYDFNYPLEVSSSVYRTNEILPVIEKAVYKNPNSLEGVLSEVKWYYRDQRPLLLCAEKSITFCVPMNKVQSEVPNRASGDINYDVESLAIKFDKGKRINVQVMKNYTPNACHQEYDFSFISTSGNTAVTVYTAAYNAEKYIAKTIESVLSQTFTNFEYIIVDDGSTDRTAEIAESYNDRRIKFYKREHKNFAAAMNYAIKNAHGEYILGVDADDYIAPDFIERMYAAALKNPDVDYIYPEMFTMIDENGNKTGEISRFQDFSGEKNKLFVLKLFYEAIGRIPNPGSLKKKEIYERLGLYEEIDTIEDFVYMSVNGLNITFKPAEGVDGYYYRQLPSSNSNRFLVRSKIMADAIFNMTLNCSPEFLMPEIKTIAPSEQQSTYLDFLYKIFLRHSQFYSGRGGEHFEIYAEKIKEQLSSKFLKAETV